MHTTCQTCLQIDSQALQQTANSKKISHFLQRQNMKITQAILIATLSVIFPGCGEYNYSKDAIAKDLEKHRYLVNHGDMDEASYVAADLAYNYEQLGDMDNYEKWKRIEHKDEGR
jgi:hypothetical protein